MRAVVAGAVLLGGLAVALPAQGKKKERPRADTIRVHILNVGQGDATIIEGPRDDKNDRKVMIVDAPETREAGNESQHRIEPYLLKHLDDGPPGRPIIDIDYLIPTHYHLDHIGSTRSSKATGIFYLWEALNIRVGKILDSGIDYDASGQGDVNYRRWVEENEVPRETLAFDQLGPDRQIDMGEGFWVEPLAVGAMVEGRGRIVRKDWISKASQNDFSIALAVHYKKFDFFVAGDLSGYMHESWGSWYHSVEAAMYPHLRPTEVYRVNHHGSQWSTNYPFLQRIKPLASIMSCGKGHHHPNEYAVQRILGFEDYWSGAPLGSDIFQTQHAEGGFIAQEPHPHTERVQHIAGGDILIESDGETYFSVSMPGREPYVYNLHPDPAFTAPPKTVQAYRQLVSEGKDTTELVQSWGRVFSPEDAAAGLIKAPEGQDTIEAGD